MTRQLGKHPRGHANLPHFSQLRSECAPIPPKVNWLSGMPDDLGVMLNDTLGDCTIAGLHHMLQVMYFNSRNSMPTECDKNVLTDYSIYCGYKMGDPTTDKGGCLQDILKKVLVHGITTNNGQNTPLSYVEVDNRNLHDVKEVIAFGGVAYVGMQIPESYTESSPGDVWDVTHSKIVGGHCIILVGYDLEGFDVISWGKHFRMTFLAFNRYVDECYWVVDKFWINAKGSTPGGITIQQLEESAESIKKLS